LDDVIAIVVFKSANVHHKQYITFV